MIIETSPAEVEADQSRGVNAMINLDADVDSADWTKQSWDLPPYLSKEFFHVMGPDFDLAHFKTLPIYKHAEAAGMIHDDEWVEDSSQVVIVTPVKA